jgi:hypothetical protein
LAQPKQGEVRRIFGTWRVEDGFLIAKLSLLVPAESSWIDYGGDGIEVLGLNSVEISVDPDAGRAYTMIK